MSDDSNQDVEDKEKSDSTQHQEDDSTTSDDLESLFEEDETSGKSREEQESEVLNRFNKLTGKKFKTLADVRKSVKEADRLFAEKGRKKEEERPPKDGKKEETTVTAPAVPKYVETLYFDNHPEAKLVWKKVQKIGKAMGRDPFEVYEDDDFSFLKTEAKTLYEETEEDEESKGKVKSPSVTKGKAGGNSGKIRLNDAERSLLARHGLTEKDVKS